MTCKTCGGPLASTSRHASMCGKCGRERAQAAITGTYTRTHVHIWPDGRRTIEAGVRCEGKCA
jgi:hypothetical protein